MTTETDKYNGWTNRETWAVSLHLGNDEGLYNWTNERIAEVCTDLGEGGETSAIYQAGRVADMLSDFLDELTDPEEGLVTCEQALTLLRDIGSLYRVDWYEIADSWIGDLCTGRLDTDADEYVHEPGESCPCHGDGVEED